MTPTVNTQLPPEAPPSDAAIERYIVGDCSGSEARDVEAWLRVAGGEAAEIRWLQGRFGD